MFREKKNLRRERKTRENRGKGRWEVGGKEIHPSTLEDHQR
jgi:hypothetical protein